MQLFILILWLFFILNCSQGDTGRTIAPVKSSTSVLSDNDSGESSFTLEKIQLKDGAEIYSPVSCKNNTCSSLFYSVVSEHNIDPAQLLRDKKDMPATASIQMLLRGSGSLVKNLPSLRIDTPEINVQPLSPKSVLVKKYSEGFEGIVSERKKSLSEFNELVEAPSVVREGDKKFSAVFNTNLNKFKSWIQLRSA